MGRSGLTDLGSAATHAHLWALPDGTGLHAPLGELAVEEGTGSLCCHLCGRWFVSLGSHVRAHGHTADSYRETMGLCRSTALTAAALSVAIAGRTTAQYRHDPELWHRLADGRAARGGGSAPQVAGYSQEPAQRVRRRQEALAAGRQAVAARRERRLAARLEHLGATGLHDYLRTAYAAGASLESLAGETGLGREGLRREIQDADIAVRRPGRNTAAGKRARALSADQVAADRVGTRDLVAWLAERRAAGWSLTRLAAAVGHSTHWIRWRLPSLDHHSPAAADRAPAHLTTKEALCGH